MQVQEYNANIYYKKTKVRLLWLIVLSAFFIIPTLTNFNLDGFLILSIPFLIFLGNLIVLKYYPTVSIIVMATIFLLVNFFFIVIILAWSKSYGSRNEMDPVKFQISYFLYFIFFLIYYYLCNSAFFYSTKWGAEKERIDKSFGGLHEDKLEK